MRFHLHYSILPVLAINPSGQKMSEQIRSFTTNENSSLFELDPDPLSLGNWIQNRIQKNCWIRIRKKINADPQPNEQFSIRLYSKSM